MDWIGLSGSFLTIYFSEDLYFQRPESITPQVLVITLNQKTNQPDDVYGFSWKATEFKKRELIVLITFDKPLWISAEGPDNLDELVVQVKNPFKFRSTATGLIM